MATKNSRLTFSEDWTACLVGAGILLAALAISFFSRPADVNWTEAQIRANELRVKDSQLSELEVASLSTEERAFLTKSRKMSTLEKLGIQWLVPGQSLFAKIGTWEQNPIEAFRKKTSSKESGVVGELGEIQWKPLLSTFLILGLIGGVAISLRGNQLPQFFIAFIALFSLAVFAYLLAAQSVIKYYNFEYPLWGLLAGMLISNSIGTPKWLAPAVCGELFIKIGLVLLGGEVLLSRLLALGLPGVFVSWVVTPIVLVTTYIFGQRVLRLSSRSLNMVISADMSVCGVSAAIATAAACKAKKEELSLAIGLSLTFTAIMMVVMPLFVQWVGMPPRIAGAWMGGTIDSTGAVTAAGESLGVIGSETAITVKMIQNILIGVIAFGVAIYWSRWVDRTEPDGERSNFHPKPNPNQTVGMGEIWVRFPKFIIGFVAASLLCSAISRSSFFGESLVQIVIAKLTSPIRAWLFCLAFVSIGLSINFRELTPYLKSGKPVALYICGQSLNLILTFLMAYLMFGWFYQWLIS